MRSINISRMSLREKLKHELKAIVTVTFYFAAWLGILMGIKVLILEDYHQHRDMPHLWANTICVTGALLFYNLIAVLNRHLGTGGLARVFLSPPRDSTSPGQAPHRL